MRIHSDEEIIQKASLKKKNPLEIKDNLIDVAVDIADENGDTHTYVVTFEKKSEAEWRAIEVNELSAW